MAHSSQCAHFIGSTAIDNPNQNSMIEVKNGQLPIEKEHYYHRKRSDGTVQTETDEGHQQEVQGCKNQMCLGKTRTNRKGCDAFSARLKIFKECARHSSV